MPNDDTVVIPNGFSKVTGTKRETESGNTRVRVKRQKRMHKFQSGYEPRGRPVTLFSGAERDAREVYEVLREWFDE
jgi:hypothetical protein